MTIYKLYLFVGCGKINLGKQKKSKDALFIKTAWLFRTQAAKRPVPAARWVRNWTWRKKWNNENENDSENEIDRPFFYPFFDSFRPVQGCTLNSPPWQDKLVKLSFFEDRLFNFCNTLLVYFFFLCFGGTSNYTLFVYFFPFFLWNKHLLGEEGVCHLDENCSFSRPPCVGTARVTNVKKSIFTFYLVIYHCWDYLMIIWVFRFSPVKT